MVIVTMTWARDAAEEKLLREALLELAKLNVPVFITDGGSGKAFLDFLKSFPHFILPETNTSGVWPQVYNSMSAAYLSGAPFILYTEPDKRDFFKKGLPDILSSLSLHDQTGIILAERSAAGFASYPAFQRMTETTINNCCFELTGHAIDYTYGPFMLNRVLVPFLEPLADNIGWGWRPYAFVMAHRLGYKVTSFKGDYFCPPEQQEDTPVERVYRMRQLNQNIEALVLSSAASLK